MPTVALWTAGRTPAPPRAQCGGPPGGGLWEGVWCGVRADDRVLLIDVENALGGLAGHPPVFRARVTALRDAAGRLHHCVAAFGLEDSADRTPLSLLAEVGVAPWPVVPGQDAADAALLEHARYVYRRGGRSFVVASADHRFATLAAMGRLEVVAWEGQRLARRLEAAAHTVRRVHRPTPRAGQL